MGRFVDGKLWRGSCSLCVLMLVLLVLDAAVTAVAVVAAAAAAEIVVLGSASTILYITHPQHLRYRSGPGGKYGTAAIHSSSGSSQGAAAAKQ